MSRKHNTKHPNRGLSKYPLRLQKRGLHKTPTMQTLQELKKQQEVKESVVDQSVYAGWELEEKAS